MELNNPCFWQLKKAIHFLVTQPGRKTTLAELASLSGMSRFQLVRVFTEGMGVGPKQFMEYLSVESLKKALMETGQQLETCASGGGRMRLGRFDVEVSVETMTVEAYSRKRGATTIFYDTADSPLGKVFVAETSSRVCAFEFIDDEEDEVLSRIKQCWSGAVFLHAPGNGQRFVNRLFVPDPHVPIQVVLKGTPFQLKVWCALLNVPYGSVASYGDIAGMIGEKGAVRAVASAVGKNPVSVIIPCHRVIRREGIPGEYRWGRVRKALLLGREKSKMCIEIMGAAFVK